MTSAIAPQAHTPIGPADKDTELLDVVDQNNVVTGQELRGVVHRKGLYHRAVYAFLFNKEGQLLIQRRSPNKSIGPLQWDLSVAEHLEPGESYAEGAARGLREELGVELEGGAAALRGPLAPPHLRKLETHTGLRDYEFVTSFRVDGYGGGVQFDAAEVCEVAWVGLSEVAADMREAPDRFTPWFRDELAALGWCSDGAEGGGSGGEGNPEGQQEPVDILCSTAARAGCM